MTAHTSSASPDAEIQALQALLAQASQALAEAEYWLRTFADAGSSALLMTRWDDGALLYTNQRFRDLVCLTSEENARTHFASEFYACPADAAALRAALLRQGKTRWEGEFRRLDGTPFRAAGSVQRSTYRGETVVFAASQSIADLWAEAGENQPQEPGQERGRGFTMLDALVTAVDNKDRYTRRHSEDVMHYSRQLAAALGLDAGAQRTLEIAALLHDVGKIGVPDAILRKPGRLTEDDYEAIKHHPLMGSVIVGAVPGFELVLDAVRHHHERWDGGGYPFGLVGEETPLFARLMAVADAYSAMTTDRPYRKGMLPDKARGILEAGSGSQWDPKCVQAFLLRG